MNFSEVETPDALERCYPVLKELRPNLSFNDFIFLYSEAKARNEYKLIGVYDQGRCVALMGYRILFDFVHGKHLYIDDLVVSQAERSKGLGAKLLEYAESVAADLNCEKLRLCTGVDQKDAQHFYEKNNWNARAIAYKKICRSRV